mgnify:CR=1 FL=1
MIDFNEIIENIQNLEYEQILEVNSLTKNYLDEMNRNNIYLDHIESKKELESGDIKFTSDLDTLSMELDSL